MKNSILILFIFISSVVFGQQQKCQRFKNGKFKIVDNELGDTFIERQNTKQIEYSKLSKVKLEFEVKWIDKCTYTLKLIKILENPYGFDFPTEMILTVEIIETKDKSYIQKSTSNLYDMIYQSEVFKIK